MISERCSKIKHWAREFLATHYEDVVLSALVFLLVSLAFGVGMFVGSRVMDNPYISVNCPASFWQKN